MQGWVQWLWSQEMNGPNSREYLPDKAKAGLIPAFLLNGHAI